MEKSLLYPVISKTRRVVSLDGMWKFQFDEVGVEFNSSVDGAQVATDLEGNLICVAGIDDVKGKIPFLLHIRL